MIDVEILSDAELEELYRAVSRERMYRKLERLQAVALARFDTFEAAFMPKLELFVTRVRDVVQR